MKLMIIANDEQEQLAIVPPPNITTDTLLDHKSLLPDQTALSNKEDSLTNENKQLLKAHQVLTANGEDSSMLAFKKA